MSETAYQSSPTMFDYVNAGTNLSTDATRDG